MILQNNAQHQLPDDGPPAVLLVDRDQHLHPPPPRHLQLTHRQVNSFLILIILVHLLEVEGRGKGGCPGARAPVLLFSGDFSGSGTHFPGSGIHFSGSGIHFPGS